jgi:hypothetical protein
LNSISISCRWKMGSDVSGQFAGKEQS